MIKNKYLSKVFYDYVEKINDINDIDLYDLFETEDYVLYVVVNKNKETNTIKAKKFPIKNEETEADLILDLTKEEDKNQIYFLFKNSNDKSKDIKMYFKIAKYEQQNFDKSKAKNFKLNDIVIDNGNKAWLVNSINSEENEIEVVKLPIVLNKLASTFINLENTKIQKLIKQIWR